MPKVLNKRNTEITPNSVYIGRGSKWGNPFILNENTTRKEVVKKYEIYLLANPDLLKALYELKGKDLVCYCAPKECHGDVLLKYSDKLYCDQCKSSHLVTEIALVQLISGDWYDVTSDPQQILTMDKLDFTNPIKCIECGHTFYIGGN